MKPHTFYHSLRKLTGIFLAGLKIKTLPRLFLAAGLALFLTAGCLSPDGKGLQLPKIEITTPTPSPDKLVIYTTYSDEEISQYLSLFRSEHPGINITTYQQATWVLTRKLIAEKDTPQADVIWGLPVTAMNLIRAGNGIEPLVNRLMPVDFDRVNPRMRDQQNPPYWTGLYSYSSALCVNSQVLEANNLPIPQTWKDLLAPAFRGQVVMASPEFTGSGMMTMAAWIESQGESKAFDYMDVLHTNILFYTSSGDAACKAAAEGQVAVGISNSAAALAYYKDSYPVTIVFPKDGLGWEVDTIALVNKSPVKPSAATFLNWAISYKAMAAYAQHYPFTSIKTTAPIPEGFSDDLSKLISNPHLYWISANYDRLVDKWTARYGEKVQSGSPNNQRP